MAGETKIRDDGPSADRSGGAPPVSAAVADEVRRDLEEFGLNGYQARVLVALAQSRSATPAEVARIAELHRPSVYPVLRELQAKGLAQPVPGKSARWAAPRHVDLVQRLVGVQEERLRHMQTRAAHTERLLAKLSAPDTGSAVPPVDFIFGAAAVNRSYEEMLGTAGDEVLVFNRPPYAWVTPSPHDAVLEALARGLAIRALYRSEELETGALAEVRTRSAHVYAKAGVGSRMVDDLPMKLVIADRQTALVSLIDPLLPDDGFPTNMVVTNPGFAAALADTFEYYWATARPLP
ncbi:MAG TPA: helix-turn-helix domain-containing protein [Acidimicrobiales bacterium]|nr:helix-turn-helix domain-containing protein [Acidimicrobiales bacterium]